MKYVLGAILLGASLTSAMAAQTVGLFVHDEQAFDGYTLMGPLQSTRVYLLSNDGLVVHAWETGHVPSHMGYLLENGHLLRAGNVPLIGLIQEFDWDSNVVWEFTLDDAVMFQHHDIKPLPNGNVLLIVSEHKTPAQAVAAGRNPLIASQGLDPETIIEVHPTPPSGGVIVWQWRSWDHLIQNFDPTKANFGVVADHPELIDINAGEGNSPSHPDTQHANGLDYNPELDQIAMSVRNFSEFWVIDHATTTAQAAGPAGGLLYRWGNPKMYGRGGPAERTLYFQHDTQWIPPGLPGAGHITVFNNGTNRPGGNYSTVDELVPAVDESGDYPIGAGVPFGPAAAIWSYSSPTPADFYSPFIGGAQRQPDGTTIVCEGWSGHLFEVTPSAEVVWDYVNPVYSGGIVTQGNSPPASNTVFKIRRYAASYPGLIGRDLTPGDPLELFQAPLPVPEGSLMASRLTVAGDQIRVQWDATSCTVADYQMLFGDLAQVSAYTLSGAECDLGLTGSHVWTGVPAGSQFFLVTGTDASGIYESSWGLASSGDQRNGYTASFECQSTTKVVSSVCQ